jgi:hypothetical protein
MAKEVTIQLGGKQPLTVDSLAVALDNTLQMLRNIEAHFVGDGDPLRWEIVRAGMASPLSITLVARAPRGQAKQRTGDKVVKAWVGGLRAIEEGAHLPEHFDEETLEAAKRLASVATEDGPTLKIFSPGEEEIELDERAVANVQEIVAKAKHYIDFGTIEGMLEQISIHKGPSFSIWESLTNYRVDCQATLEQLEKAKELLGRRVAITGRIRYKNHKPQSIDIESIRILRPSAALPQPRDIGPIDITGGASSEDYVRRLRDAR